MRQALVNSNETVKRGALDWLSTLYVPELAPLLQERLRNTDTMPTRSPEAELVQIVQFFGNGPSDPTIVKLLLEQLQSAQFDNTKIIVALSLAKLQAREAVPTLIELLNDESAHSIRPFAAVALGKLVGAEARTALKKTLSELRADIYKIKENPQDFNTRIRVQQNSRILEQIVKSLASLGEPIAVTVFLETLDMVESFAPEFTHPLFGSQTIVSMLQSIPQQFYPQLREAVRPLLNHAQSLVGMRASLILNAIGDHSSTPIIIELINLARISSIFVKVPLLFELFDFALADFVQDEALVIPIAEFLGILKGPVASKEEANIRRGTQVFLTAVLGSGLSLKGAEKQEFEGCITPPASNLGRDPSSLGRGSYSTAWL